MYVHRQTLSRHLLWMVLDLLCLLIVFDGFFIHLLADEELSSVTESINVVWIQFQYQTTPMLPDGHVAQLEGRVMN